MTRSSDAILPTRKATRSAGWRRWGTSLLVATLLLLLLEGGHRWLESRSQAPLFRVIVAGESLTLDAETHAAFSRDLAGLIAETPGRLSARMTPWVDARLAAAYAPLEAAVPGYLDWYFSAMGSYTRLGVALVGDLDDWLDEQLYARLVEPSGIEAALAELQADYPRRLARAQQELAGELATTLHERYAARQVEAEEGEGEGELSGLDLDGVLQQALHDGLDGTRWRVAAVGGGGLGLLAGRTMVARLGGQAAVQGSRVALRGLAARVGVGTARALLGGGAAAAASAPTGPAALVAGTITTAATLAGVAGSEYALLKAQEALHRPAMQAQLQEELSRARASMALTLEASTAGAARALEESLARSTSREAGAGQTPEAYRILGWRGE